MLPKRTARAPKEETTLEEVRRLLDQGRVGPAIVLLQPLSSEPSTSTRGLRRAAALFARARALPEAVTAARALAQRYETEGQPRLAAGALHQAYGFAKSIGPDTLVADIRADLAHVLSLLGHGAEPGQAASAPPLPAPRPRSAPPPDATRNEVASTLAALDFVLELGDLEEARAIAQAFLARNPGEPTIAAMLDGLALFADLEDVPNSVVVELRRPA